MRHSVGWLGQDTKVAFANFGRRGSEESLGYWAAAGQYYLFQYLREQAVFVQISWSRIVEHCIIVSIWAGSAWWRFRCCLSFDKMTHFLQRLQ